VKAFPLSNRELAQPKHGLSRQLAGPPINYVTSPPRILLQESRDSSLYAKTIYHSQWRNWRGRGANSPSPGNLNVKTGPPPEVIFRF